MVVFDRPDEPIIGRLRRMKVHFCEGTSSQFSSMEAQRSDVSAICLDAISHILELEIKLVDQFEDLKKAMVKIREDMAAADEEK